MRRCPAITSLVASLEGGDDVVRQRVEKGVRHLELPLGQPDGALLDADECVLLSNHWWKGYYRKYKSLKLLKKKNITPKEYEDALAIEDPIKRDEALKELSYKTNTWFKRTIQRR